MTNPTKTDDDSQVLHPDASMTIDGREVEVREFRYKDGLRAAAIARPIISGLRGLISEIKGRDEIDLSALEEIMGEHPDAWVELIALSTGQDADWIAGLPDREGLNLSILFWEVNAPFFTRRLVLSIASEQPQENRSRPQKSSPNSSAPATGETTTKSASG